MHYVTPSGNSSAALQAANNDAARTVYVPRGTYSIDEGVILSSNRRWVGDGDGLTVFKSVAALGTDPFYGAGLSNITFEGITFDFDGLGTAPGGRFPSLLPFLYLVSSSKIRFVDCGFVGFSTCALLGNVVSDFQVERCRFQRATPSTGPISGNHGIVISAGAAPYDSHDIVIDNNQFINCQISTNCRDFKITNNRVKGWGFSAGINTQALADSYNGIISHNIVGPSNQSQDAVGFYISGIENWARNTIISNNTVFGCYGSGIDIGGKSLVTGNICFDNGAGTPAGGISMHYYDATFNSSGSLVSDNICFDSRPVGSKTQAYGYYAVSPMLSGIVHDANNFNGNLTANSRVG